MNPRVRRPAKGLVVALCSSVALAAVAFAVNYAFPPATLWDFSNLLDYACSGGSCSPATSTSINVANGIASLKQQTFQHQENASPTTPITQTSPAPAKIETGGFTGTSDLTSSIVWKTDHLELNQLTPIPNTTAKLLGLWHLDEGGASQTIADDIGGDNLVANNGILGSMGDPAPTTPLQSAGPAPTSFIPATGGVCPSATFGYLFTPSSSGKITALGGYWDSMACRSTYLWSYNPATLLATAPMGSALTVCPTAPLTWTYANYPAGAEPVVQPYNSITQPLKYIVYQWITSGNYGLSPVGVPTTSGGVTIERGVNNCGPAVPTAGMTAVGGVADIKFVPTGPETVDPAWVTGKFGSALQFDGVNDYAQIPNTPLNGATAADNWTIEAWVYYTGGEARGQAVFNGNLNSTGYGFGKGNGDEIWVLYSTAGGGNAPQGTTGATFDRNAWQHIAVVRSGGLLKAYKNGRQIGADDLDGATSPIAPTTSDTLYIGAASSSAYRFGGIIDEVAVYNRALTPQEIAQHAVSLPQAGYASPVIDSGSLQWQSLAWTEGPVPNLGDGPAPDTAGLVALWHLDELSGAPSFADTTCAAGGTCTNTTPDTGSVALAPATPTWIPNEGFIRGGLSFDGGDYATIPSSPALSPTSQVSVGAWVKFSDVTSGQYLISKAGGLSWNSYALYKDPSLNRFVFQLTLPSGVWSAWSSTVAQPGTWYYVVGTYDGTAANMGMRVYVNGTLAGASSPPVDTISQTSNPVYLGQYGNGSNYFNGTLDEVTIDNVALSAAAVQQRYQQVLLNLRFNVRSGLSATPDATWTDWQGLTGKRAVASLTNGLVGLWHLDEASGTTASDATCTGTGCTNLASDTGTLAVAPATPTWQPAGGRINGALSFNGSQYVTIPDSSELRPASAVSVEAWVTLSNPLFFTEPLLAKQGPVGSSYGLGYTTFPQPAFRFSVASSTTSFSVDAPVSVVANQWYHVVGTYDSASSSVKVYVNGTLTNSGAFSGALGYDTSPVYLGRDTSVYLTGTLDEAAVYNRALSANEVRNHYYAAYDYFTQSPASLSALPANRYLQFRALLESGIPALSPQLFSATVQAASYPTGGAPITNVSTNAPSYTVLGTFTETKTATNQGVIKYQVSPDNLNWYYWRTTLPAQWVVVPGGSVCDQTSAYCNDAATVSSNLGAFAAQTWQSNPKFYWKAFLISNGSQSVELDQLAAQADVARLTLTAPLATDTWLLGQTKTITWNSTGGIQNVKIEYDPDTTGGFGGADVKTIALSAANTSPAGTYTSPDGTCTAPFGSACYVWKIPVDTSFLSPARVSGIKISVVDPQAQYMFASSGLFSVVPGLQFIQPAGGETWLLNQTKTIAWKASADTTTTVTLRYSDSGNFTVQFNGYVIANAIPNASNGGCTVPLGATGCFPWFIDSAVFPISTSSTNPGEGLSKISLSYSTVPDASAYSNPFTVSWFKVFEPSNNATWLVGQPYTIRWVTSASKLLTVNIAYAPDGNFAGPGVKTIKTAAVHGANPDNGGCVPQNAAQGCYTWIPDATFVSTIPDPNAGQAKIRVTGATPAGFDVLVGEAGPITVTQLDVIRPKATNIGDIALPPEGAWRLGKTKTISWKTTAFGVPKVKLEYALDGVTYTKLIAAAANDGPNPDPTNPPNNCTPEVGSTGCYTWQIPFDLAWLSATPGEGNGKVRITGLDSLGNVITTINGTVPFANASEGFSLKRPWIQVTSPVGGEVVGIGQVKTITWQLAENYTQHAAGNQLQIQFSKDGGATYVNLTNNGMSCNAAGVMPQTTPPGYDWVVQPTDATSQAVIRLQDLCFPEGNGYTFPVFKIAGTISVSDPVAGAKLPVGKPHTIRWTAAGLKKDPVDGKPYVKIELSKDNGATFTVIAPKVLGVDPATANPLDPGTGIGTFSWTPAASDATTQAVIRVTDAFDADVKGLSPIGLVTTVSVTSPAAGERLLVGSTKQITWSPTGLTTIRLEYTTNGVTFKPVDLLSVTKPAVPTSYTWTVPDDVKANGVQIRIQDVDVTVDPVTGASSRAEALSSACTIYGVLALVQPAPTGASPTASLNAGQPYTVAWNNPVGQSIQAVRLDYSTDNFASVQSVTGSVANGPTGCTLPAGSSGCFVWTPGFTSLNVWLRISDAQDPQTVHQATSYFEVTGIAVAEPGNAVRLLRVGQTQTVSWTKTGAFSSVNLEYSTNGGTSWQPMLSGAGLPATNEPTGPNGGSFAWRVPDAISSTVKVRIAPSGNPGLSSTSSPFAIAGVLDLTAPDGDAGQMFVVGDTTTVQWTTTGTIPQITLQLSTDSGSTWSNITAAPIANSNSYLWTIPNAISSTVRVRVLDASGGPVDAATGEPVAQDRSQANFLIRANLGFVDPPASTANGWGVNDIRAVTWTTKGTVGRVTLEYFDPNTGTWAPLRDQFGTAATNIQNIGSFDWKVPDLVTPKLTALGQPLGAGSVNHTVSGVMIRLADADPNHPPTTLTSALFTVKWYRVKWVIFNADTSLDLGDLNVDEPPTWSVQSDCQAGSPPCLSSPVYRHYPSGTYVTKWTTKNFSPTTIQGWAAVRDGTAGKVGSQEWDKVNPVPMTSTLPDPTAYQVHVEHAYGAATDTLTLKAWLEKQGTIPVDLLSFGASTVELYDGQNLLRTLTADAPRDGSGLPIPTWSGSYDYAPLSPTGLVPGTIYFAKASITYRGVKRTSGGTVNITIPKQIQQVAVDVGTVKADAVAIKAATVGPTSSLEQVKTAVTTAIPQAITDAQGAVQASVANAQTALGNQIGGVQTTADAIKAQTDKISTDVIPGVTGVKAYLEDASTGLPAIQQKLTAVQTQAKALRRGGLLNRDMAVAPNELATIQYRPVDASRVPSLSVYEAAGNPVPAPPMLLNSNGLYETKLSLASLGDYRVVVTEAASTDSAGTIDSMTLSVRPATAQGGTDLGTQLTALSAQLSSLDAKVSSLSATAGAIQTRANEAKAIADKLSADTTALLKQPAANAQGIDATTLMARIAELQKTVESAQGSAAAVGLAQGAFAAASEAVTILQQLQAEIRTNTAKSTLAPMLLGQFGDKMKEVSNTVTVIPGKLDVTEFNKQLTDLTERLKSVATEKGYHFDELYQMTEAQGGDVKTVRNRVEELKALVEVQKAILEQRLNEPIVKTWFEAGR